MTAPAPFNRGRADALLEAHGVDALLATGPENIAYFTGYVCQTHWVQRRTLGFVLYERGAPPVVVAPAFEVDAWAEMPPREGEIRLYGLTFDGAGRELGVRVEDLLPDDRLINALTTAQRGPDSAYEVLARAVEERGLQRARIALDGRGLTHEQHEQVEASLPKATVVDGEALVSRIRMVKTAVEVERLERAAKLASRALAATLAIVEPGVSERELYRHYAAQVASGGGVPGFAVINAGRRSGHPHSLPSDYRLHAGDVVKCDVGGTVDLYHSDIGRTIVVGPAEPELERAHAALVAGVRSGIAAVRPGALPREIFEITVQTVRDSGLPSYRRHHVGHGIGIEMYDPPLIVADGHGASAGADEPLEAGMVINVETPYYVLGRHGMIAEDTVVVTHDGVRYLSDLSHSLEGGV